ncbi:MAG TPA: ATP-binding protein [Ktedonobacteraceae bacterium]
MRYSIDHLDASTTLAALLDEFSAVTDYRTLRDNLPRCLAGLLRCRCVLLYQRLGEALQFASGSFADQPGWSAALLAVAHINPIELNSEIAEAQTWRARKTLLTTTGGIEHAQVCAPLIYRQRAIGVLTAIRGLAPGESAESAEQDKIRWHPEEALLIAVAANIVAMLLENTRLLERDRERIHELSLLNGITSQMNCGLREQARVQHIVVQRAKEIALPDLCAILTPGRIAQPAAETAAPALASIFEASVDAPTWLPPRLEQMLIRRWQSDPHATHLALERESTHQTLEYMEHLDPRIKTFFAIPLLRKRGTTTPHPVTAHMMPTPNASDEQGTRVHGVLVGAYYKSRQLRREEQVLLQILANQASAVLENIALMDDVIEARNEARRLLRQVLDDQRFKELILESIPSGLITIDLHGHITTFNQAAEAVLGYHPREVMHQPVRKVLDLRDLEKCLQSGQAQHETLLTSGRQGQEIALEVTLMPLRDERGAQIGVLATFADITSVYQLEEEKRRLDRLASLGEMSANVAHEVRNPLAAIKTSMQMLRADLESSHSQQTSSGAQEEINVVLKEVERLDGIVRDLLLFARPRQFHALECDLGQLCVRILHFLQPQCIEHGVSVRLIQQDLPLVRVDVAQIEQVLLNIFLNALQAMADGGILSVSCQVLRTPGEAGASLEVRPLVRQFQPAENFIITDELKNEPETREAKRDARRNTLEQQTWLEVAISDTGVGIAQDALERIFQPFYTTKAHGIGLGLPISRRLVEDHHGHILVESQLGYGTTVSLCLPVSQEALEAQPAHVEGEKIYCESDHPDC